MQQKLKRISLALLVANLFGCATTASINDAQHDVSKNAWGVMSVMPEDISGQGHDFHKWDKQTLILCVDCKGPTPKTRIMTPRFFKKTGGFVLNGHNGPTITAPPSAQQEPQKFTKMVNPYVKSSFVVTPTTVIRDKSLPTKMAQSSEPDMEKDTVLHTIHFDWAKSVVSEDDKKILKRLTQTHKQKTLKIIGYTDNTKVEEGTITNETLAIKRAEAIKTALVGDGFPPQQIEVVGMEMCCYVSDNDSEKGRSLNRRAEISAVIIQQ